MDQAPKHVVRLERDDATDYLLPKDFYDILVQRFIPILSLTFISTLLGIAVQKGDLIFYLFQDKTAYIMALFVVFWVSIPGLLWIFLKGSPLLCVLADTWYKIVSFLQVLTITLSAVLFPEADIYGLKIYFVVTVPLFILMYIFLVKGAMPSIAAYPLNIIGLAILFYGSLINVFFG